MAEKNETDKPKVYIYTDGACSGNPGKGGYGAVLEYTDTKGNIHQKKLSQGFKLTTNNRMELLAAIISLETLKIPSDVVLTSDSKYLIDAINNNWLVNWQKNNWKNASKKPVKNKDLWLRLIEQLKEHNVKFEWIKGHNGHPKNEECDRLAVNAYNSLDLLDDKNFNN